MTEKQPTSRLNEALEDLLELAQAEREGREIQRKDSPWARAFRRDREQRRV